MSAIDAGAGESAAEKEKREDKTLNNLVAVTVVILTVFMAISKTKDDNINQAMQKAKADSVDAWAEYQFARVKLHVDENGLNQLRLLESGGQIDKALAAKQAAEYEADIKKYEGRSKETRAKAERLEAEYDRLNFRDDQFDMSDVFLSIAIAVAAVAALVDSFCAALFRLGERRARACLSGSRALRAGISGPNGWRACWGRRRPLSACIELSHCSVRVLSGSAAAGTDRSTGLRARVII